MAGEQPSQTIDVDNVRYLNKDAGALSKELGLISDETEALVGEIQARALTIAMLYQTGDDALKTALEEANLIIDDKNRDDVIVGKKFNSNLLFAFKDAEKEQADLSPEELLTNIAERLNQETSEVNFTDFSTVDKTSEEARAIVESKSGIQAEGRPFVPPANQIAGLAATDESKAFRDAILPIQAFIRSNYLDFPTDELGLDGKDFNFNIPTLGFLPDNVKEVIDAGRRLSEAHSAGEAPSQQDIDTVEAGLDIAIEDLKKIDFDLSPFIINVEQLKTEAKSLSWDDVIKASAENSKLLSDDFLSDDENAVSLTPLSLTAGSVNESDVEDASDNKGFFAGLVDKATDRIKNIKNGGLSEGASRLERYLNGLEKAQGASFNQDAKQAATDNGNLAWMSETLDVESLKNGRAVFVDNVQGHKIVVTPTTISHHDNDANFSMEEAIQYVSLAAANPKMMKEGITISGGTPEQQAMIVVASKALKASGQAVPKINNSNDIQPQLVAQIAEQHLGSFIDQGLATPNGVLDFSKMQRNPEVVQQQEQEVEVEAKPDSDLENKQEAAPQQKADQANFEKDSGASPDKSPSAEAVKTAFQGSAELPKVAYRAVKSHVQETGHATNADITEALKGYGIESSSFDAAFSKAKELLAKENFIDAKTDSLNRVRLSVKSNAAPKPSEA